MKKLLFAINAEWYYRLHWEERMTSRLVDDYEVHICTSGVDENIQGKMHFHKLAISRYSVGLLNNLHTLLNARKLVKEINPDLIHAVTIKPNIMFGLICYFKKKKIVMTLPGLGHVFSNSGIKNSFLKVLLLILYKIISKNSNAFFVFENRTDLEYMSRKGICNKQNSKVVPGAGVDISRFEVKPIPDLKQGYNILFAARMLKSKGLFEAISAIENLRQEGLHIKLNVAGIIDQESPDKIPLDIIESLDKEGKINWLGSVENMPAEISKNHFIVLPTRYGEGLPRILIEASSCGRAVISSKEGGCKDFIKHEVTGLLLEENDVKTLTNSIREMCINKYYLTYGINGRKLVEQCYTSQHVIQVYEEIYEKVQK